MTGAATWSIGACLLALSGAGAGAQVVDTIITSGPSLADELHCGTYAAAASADAGARAAAPAPRATDTVRDVRPAEAHAPIDQRIVLDIASRDWRRDAYDGGIALGTDDLRHAGGPSAVCAGVSVHLGQAAVALRGVRGVVHLHADFSALEGLQDPRRLPGSRPDHPSSPPPAVPPRR